MDINETLIPTKFSFLLTHEFVKGKKAKEQIATYKFILQKDLITNKDICVSLVYKLEVKNIFPKENIKSVVCGSPSLQLFIFNQ